MIARLRKRFQGQRERHRESVATSGITAEGNNPEQQGEELDRLNDKAADGIVRRCIAPFRRALSPRNIISVLGRSAASLVLLPKHHLDKMSNKTLDDWYSQILSSLDDVDPSQAGSLSGESGARRQLFGRGSRAGQGRRRETVAGRGTGAGQDRRRETVAGRGAGAEQGRETATRGEAGTGQKRERRDGWFRGWLDNLRNRDPNARTPYTEDSAALSKMGLVEDAYRMMREPGANPEKVRESYESALRVLDERIETDGLDKDGVNRRTRVLVGQAVERDPDRAVVFGELSHGQYVKTDPQEMFLPGSAKSLEVWDGDYVNRHSGEKLTEGVFSPREPMDSDGHRVAVGKSIYGELASATSADQFDNTLRQYIIGSTTREYPGVVEKMEGPDGRARMGRSRAMFASMQADGLSDQDQALTYMGGLSEAMKTLEDRHPDKLKQWYQTLGPEWEQEVQDLVKEHRDFGQQAEAERERQQEADQESLPYSREELGSRAGLVDEQGRVDQGRLAVTEAKGVSLERAARPEGDWQFDADSFPGADDDKAKQEKLVEAMSEHMAKDMLDTRHLNNGKNPNENLKDAAKAWRNRATALGPPDSRQAVVKSGPRDLHEPWNEDVASNARAREMVGMSASMGSLDTKRKDELHARAFRQALEKVAKVDPSAEVYMRGVTQNGGGDPDKWLEHAEKAAMARGQSRYHRRPVPEASQQNAPDTAGKRPSGPSGVPLSKRIEQLASAGASTSSADKKSDGPQFGPG